MISHITDSNGHTFFDRMEIEHVFTDYFEELWTDHSPSSFSKIFQALPSDLPKISKNAGTLITRNITKLEVHHQDLLSLPNKKSLGSDRFNANLLG